MQTDPKNGNLLFMKVKVDKEKCLGCGACVAIAPKSFRLDKEGKSEPIDPPGDAKEIVENALESCPVAAITIENSK